MLASEINRSMQEIRSSMFDCASKIGNCIALGSQMITEKLDQSNTLAAANLEVGKQLVSAQELNNALQKKSNESVDRLLRDYQVVNDRLYR